MTTELSPTVLEAIGGRTKRQETPKDVARRLLNAALRGPSTAAPTVVTVTDNASINATLTGTAYDGTTATFNNPVYFTNVGAPFKIGNGGVVYNNGGVIFGTDAPEFEFWMRSGKFEIWVDGVEATGSPFTSLGDGFKRCVLPSAKPMGRVIEIRFLKATTNFTGMVVRKQYRIWPVIAPPTVYVMGDSYTEAVPYGDLTAPRQGWAMRLGRKAGWDVYAGGVGGSGFTAAPTFLSRVASIPLGTDHVIVAGLINDDGATTGQITTAVSDCLTAIRARLPNALITMLGPWRAPGRNPVQAISDAGKAGFDAVKDAGMNFVDLYALNVQDGSGGGGAGLKRSGPLVFTANPTTSPGTLTTPWTEANGVATVTFETAAGGVNRTATLTQGSTNVTWTGGAVAATTPNAYAAQASSGNSDIYFSNDQIHPSTLGHEYLGSRVLDEDLKWLRTLAYAA